jgi:hypothetical protein
MKKKKRRRKKINEKNEKRKNKKRVQKNMEKTEKVSKEGSEHEPARFMQVKRPPCMHSFKLWPYTSAKKTFCRLAPPNPALAR